MHLLYLDESGSTREPGVQHIVLAGVSFFERSTHWAEQKLNDVVRGVTAGDIYEVELHGSPMHGGRGMWRRIPADIRRETIKEALRVGVGDNRDARVFAAVIKRDTCGVRDPVELAFEELCRRYDIYLSDMHRRKDTQRGIIIFDKCNTETRIQALARSFKYAGHAKGITRNYAEVPLYLDSKASRLIQLADLVAYSIFKAYEHGDSTYFDIFKERIHKSSPNNTGLFECL